jgi:hypothetical protein
LNAVAMVVTCGMVRGNRVAMMLSSSEKAAPPLPHGAA